MKTLSEVSHKLAENMYKKDEANDKKKKDDDVIDAEVE